MGSILRKNGPGPAASTGVPVIRPRHPAADGQPGQRQRRLDPQALNHTALFLFLFP